MRRLHLDVEFYSPISIKAAPLDVYASHPEAKLLMAAYAVDQDPVKVWTYEDGPCAELREGLANPDVTVVSWNCGYERTALAARGLRIPIERWEDVMVHARYAGLPGRLKDCAKVPMIGVPAEEKTKSETLLINKFCMPNKAGRRVMPSEHPEDWARFVEYCRRDVATMRHIQNWLIPRFPFPASERELWILDQMINERGLPVDINMAAHAEREALRIAARSNEELKTITQLVNPNSVQQLLPWLQKEGYPYDSLGKEFLNQSLNNGLSNAGREVVLLRLGAAKASVKKFRVIREMAS